MIIDNQDCDDRIKEYTLSDWQPLLALIPKIDKENYSDLETLFHDFKSNLS